MVSQILLRIICFARTEAILLGTTTKNELSILLYQNIEGKTNAT
jgi:hypothetical protein